MKKGLLAFFLFLVLLFASMSFWVYMNRSTIKSKAIDSINQQLAAPVEVNGAIDITFISTFPNVSLQLEKVLIKDKNETKDTLAFLSKVNVAFNVIQIYQGNYSIKSIKLQNGILNLKTDANGNMNFDIIKKRASTQNESFKLNLDEILVENVALKYLNQKEKIAIVSDLKNATIQGKFYEENFLINISTQAFFKKLDIKKTTYLKDKLVNGKVQLNYTSENQCFELSKNEIIVDGVSFIGVGNFCNLTQSIDIKAGAKGSNLANALNLVPSQFLETSFDVNGNYKIDASIIGNYQNPIFDVNFDLNNGALKLKEPDLHLKEINLSGSFNSKQNELDIQPFSTKIDDAFFSGNCKLSGDKFNTLTGEIHGEIQKELLNKMNQAYFTMEAGKINFDTLNFEIQKRKIDSTWILENLSGHIDFREISFNIPDFDKANFNINGKLSLKDKNAHLEKLIISYGKNQLETSLNLSNYLNYFQTNEHGENQALGIDGKIASTYFNVNDFILEDKKKIEDKVETDKMLFSNWLKLNGNITLTINELVYLDAILKDISGEIIPENNRSIRIHQLEANSMDGSLKGNMLFNLTKQNLYEMTLNSRLTQMNIQKIFSSFQDFDQTSITSKNLKGTTNAKIFLHAVWDENGDIIQDKLVMQSDIEIFDGELINLESLKALSGHLSVEQLEHIYFTDLSSTITIIDREILIPKTNIQSNLLTLDVHGKYTFDHIIDYAIILNLKNLLATKFRKNRTLDENYVNDTKGGINIYISLKGPIDDLTIKYDKKSVKSKIKDDFKNEKENFKNIFKKDGEIENGKEEDVLYFDKEDDKYLDW